MMTSSLRCTFLSIALLLSSPLCALSWTLTSGLGTTGEIPLTPQLISTPTGDSFVIWDNDTVHAIQTATLSSGSTTWSTPNTVTSGANYMTPQVAFYNNGSAVAVWRNATLNKVQGSIYTALTSTWSTPTNISTIGQAVDPQIAVYSNGNAISVWDHNGQGTQTSTYSALTSTWSAPLNLSAPSVRSPKVGVDPNDNTITIWDLTVGVFGVQATHLPASSSTWSSPQYLSNTPTQQVLVPYLAVADNGNAVALWMNRLSNTVQGATYDASTQTWTTNSHISAVGEVASNSAQVAINKTDGQAIAIWFNTLIKAIQVSIYSPTSMTWSCPTTISPVNVNIGLPQAAFDSNGNILAVWENKDTVTIEAATLLNGDTSWTFESAEIPLTGPVAGNPQLVFNTYGEAVVLWTENIAGIRTMYAAVSSNLFVP